MNDKTELLIIINNKMIMKLVEEFIKDKAEKPGTYDKINYVRLWKKLIIPAELVGMRGL